MYVQTSITRRSHIATSTSSTRSSHETHAKLHNRSSGNVGGGGVGVGVGDVGGATPLIERSADHHQQQSYSQHDHNQHRHHHHSQQNQTHTQQASNSCNSSRPPAPHMRTCKKTRFLLEPNRRSWSESDLLKEIDSELKLAKGFLYANARPQLKSTGYQSEPEPNYDSDYSTVKYRTLDRRRLQSVSSATNVANRSTNSYQDDKLYGTMPNPIKSEPSTYKNQPGRIEDYVTGRSSVSEKERKEWWDEVMDIFNGHLDQAKLSPHYTEGNLSRALAKESGYTSDSNLVFRKREAPQASPLSPVEQKQAYKSVQAGGEPPLFGFRKPAPERPRESPNRYLESDVNIHFKTPIRHEYKQAMSDEELAQRQAEQMQKLYQEERRRKYLQELQDMNARRHTDNFTPTQKSPIPLNRYDDFQSDLAPKSPNTITTRTAARALYNFQGQNARELSFKKGDIIYIRRQIDRNWYEGEHNAMIGLLPVSYVEIVNKESTRLQPKKPSEGQARAKYNFQAQSGIELSLNKGELVTLTRRVDENWFEGKIANRKGIFPVSYVEVLTDIGAEDIAARTVISEHASVTNLRPSLDTLRTNINNEFNFITKNGHQPPNGILKETKQHHSNKIDALHVDTHSEPLVYRALYKYRPQNSDEMELLEGDIVHVLEICDDGWFVGTSQRTGCFGTFPGNYVERVL
ncbi:PREDICTED: sorbin and SH3 domain-containing protein 1 isoform X7 [Rhagoletis zephyria]|uniref:sorbin and SH3 domain-containing protein 1 isoform X7 n=1 Tax=Rhagoletis zephyria TaxID=28612 RepID=UPI0008116A7D|nr:PREDICTED: sorbin and SH3 domain-containing protein 1 isoform X7 [Rhagoletis zephyria]